VFGPLCRPHFVFEGNCIRAVNPQADFPEVMPTIQMAG
jgi:hypothetical protein